MVEQKVNEIIEGDSLKVLSDLDLFPSESIDFIITSPPYADRRKKTYRGVPANQYVQWFLSISQHLYRILKKNGSFVLNIKEHAKDGEKETYVLQLILELKKQGWLWVEEYCWYKKNSFPGKWPHRFRDSWERCLHFSKQRDFKMYQNAVKVPIGSWAEKRFKSLSKKDLVRHISKTNGILGRKVSNWLKKKKVNPHNVLTFEEEHYLNASNVLEFATACSNRNHSAVFPLELPTWFLKLFTRKGHVVLDPFMGSGTTAVACKLLKRKFMGVEINKEFVKIAKKNIRDVNKLIAS